MIKQLITLLVILQTVQPIEMTLYKEPYHYSYRIPLQVGTPPQQVFLVLDTGSIVLALNSYQCANCNPHNKFNHKKSASFIDQKKIEVVKYSDGNNVCMHGSDIIHLNNHVRLRVDLAINLKLGVNMGGIGGVWGIDKIIIHGKLCTNNCLLYKLVNQHYISHRIMSIRLTDTHAHSKIIFGKIEPKYCISRIHYRPFSLVYPKYLTTVNLISVYSDIRHQNLINSDPNNKVKNAMIDTGNELISLEYQVYNQLANILVQKYKLFPVLKKEGGNFKQIYCIFRPKYSKYFPTISFQLDRELNIKLEPRQYLYKCTLFNARNYFLKRKYKIYGMKYGDYLCKTGFEAFKKYDHTDLILGALFMQRIYLIIDYEHHRLGIAESPYLSTNYKIVNVLKTIKSKV